MRRASIGGYYKICVSHQGGQLLQCVLAADVARFMFHASFDLGAILDFKRRGAANQNNVHVVLFNRVIGQLGIAYSGPVSQSVAGAWAYDQVFSIAREVRLGELMVRFGYRYGPARRRGLQPQWLQKTGQTVAYVLSVRRLYAFVDKQAVKVLAACLVVSDSYSCRNAGGRKVCPEGDLHMQEGIEFSPFHLCA